MSRPGRRHGLRGLPPEPWGRRLRRMREDVAGLTLEEATAAMARFVIVSTATISRLEGLREIPSDPRQLRTAFVLCLVCGVDPAELGLGPKGEATTARPGVAFNALPAVVRDALRKEFGTTASTKWYVPTLAVDAVAA